MKPVQVKDFEMQLSVLWLIPIISGFIIFFALGPIPAWATVIILLLLIVIAILLGFGLVMYHAQQDRVSPFPPSDMD